jgi:hypothetical protein
MVMAKRRIFQKGFDRTAAGAASWEFHPRVVLTRPYPLPATL